MRMRTSSMKTLIDEDANIIDEDAGILDEDAGVLESRPTCLLTWHQNPGPTHKFSSAQPLMKNTHKFSSAQPLTKMHAHRQRCEYHR